MIVGTEVTEETDWADVTEDSNGTDMTEEIEGTCVMEEINKINVTNENNETDVTQLGDWRNRCNEEIEGTCVMRRLTELMWYGRMIKPIERKRQNKYDGGDWLNCDVTEEIYATDVTEVMLRKRCNSRNVTHGMLAPISLPAVFPDALQCSRPSAVFPDAVN